MRIDDLTDKSLHDEIVSLLSLAPTSPAAYRLFAAARHLSAQLCHNRAEVQAQFVVNPAPCPKNCMFCSCAAKNGVFRRSSRISPEATVDAAREFEANGANAIYLMATAGLDPAEFCKCRDIFGEADWQPLDGRSSFFADVC